MSDKPAFDWGDLTFLIAIAEEGSTLAAARELGINQTTVARRLDCGQLLSETFGVIARLPEFGPSTDVGFDAERSTSLGRLPVFGADCLDCCLSFSGRLAMVDFVSGW